MNQTLDILKEISADVLGTHAQIRKINWSDLVEGKSRDEYYCATIPMHGKDLELTFSAFFVIDEATPFVAKKHHQTSNDLVIDFFKEFCNLIYGEYKRTFSDIGWNIAQTLPESYVAKNSPLQPSKYSNQEFWELSSRSGKVYINLQFIFPNQSSLEGLKKTVVKDPIEFL